MATAIDLFNLERTQTVNFPTSQSDGFAPVSSTFGIFHSFRDQQMRNPHFYRGTSRIRKCTPQGPYRKPMPRVLGGGRFFISEVTLYRAALSPCTAHPHFYGTKFKALIGPCRCRVNVAQVRQSRPDYGLGFQVKVLSTFQVVPSSLCSGGGGEVVFAHLPPHRDLDIDLL